MAAKKTTISIEKKIEQTRMFLLSDEVMWDGKVSKAIKSVHEL